MRARAHTLTPAPAAQLSVKDVTKSYGPRTVLDQVSLTVRPGERAAVIGENGAGKSTLLRLLAGAETPDDGDITVVFPGGSGHLTQTPALEPDRTVQDAVDHALAPLRTLERRLRAAEERLGEASEAELAAYGDLLTAYEQRDGYRADARVDAAMHGLGLSGVPGTGCSARSPAASSPGWRSPASWPRTPNCCCWTSRRTISTRPRCTGWRNGCARTAAPS